MIFKNTDQSGDLSIDGSTLPNSPLWLTIYHEFGHAYYDQVHHDANEKGKALEFENEIRKINGLKLRENDDVHRKY